MYLSLVSGAPFAAGAVAREHHSPEMRMSDECDEECGAGWRKRIL